MDKLRAYLNSLGQGQQVEFAMRCETSIGYLRKAISVGQKIGESLCINIERESKGAVVCEDVRPDVDWAYLRGTNCPADQRDPTREPPHVMAAKRITNGGCGHKGGG